LLFWLPDGEAELLELGFGDGGRGVREGVRARLGLREGDHLPDVLFAGQDRDQPIHAERESGVRRRAVAERVEQEAESLLRGFGVDTDQREDPLLHVAAIDPLAARTQLPTV